MSFKTKCDNCYFSVLENEQQVGCSLGRLEKYKEKGLAEKTDNYYLIGTFCNSVRTPTWAEKQENPFDAIKVERRSTITAIVEYNKDYEKTIDSLLEQTILPSSIRLLVNGDKLTEGDIAYILDKYGKYKQFLLVREFQHTDVKELIQKWVYVKDVNLLKTTYFTYVQSPIEDKTVIEQLDNLVNNELKEVYRFVYKNGTLDLTLMYKYYPEPNFTEDMTFYAKT